MASSIFAGKGYSGFFQGNIGNGINEGYTELLTNRYFSRDYTPSYSYQYLTIIVEKLEKIVGKEKMESLYLNANLLGLIEELKKYSKEEDIMKFIANTDFIKSHIKKEKIRFSEKNLVLKSLKEINKFLVISYYNMLRHNIHNEKITTDKSAELLQEFLSELSTSISFGKNNFDICNLEEVLNWIKEETNNKPSIDNSIKKK